MTWHERDLKIVALASFISCQIGQEAGTIPAGRVSAIVYGCCLRLTCVCGAVCTLVYREETMAALWGLRCLTEQYGAVPGAIQTGNLTELHLNYWQNTAELPTRASLLSLMRKAVRPVRQAGTNSSTRRKNRNLLIGGQRNVSRETLEDM